LTLSRRYVAHRKAELLGAVRITAIGTATLEINGNAILGSSNRAHMSLCAALRLSGRIKFKAISRHYSFASAVREILPKMFNDPCARQRTLPNSVPVASGYN
jgi:hypothetical protein